ncbi:MAG TPA: peptidoglycan DD-metalloendopeptidase family protein [Chloroflexota bacterium]|nr:peptidoglycan DD-metalloendopeptidase family protein [Chloroflexota bacterium]
MKQRSIALACALSAATMLAAAPAAPAASIKPALLAPSVTPTPPPAPKGPRIYKLPYPGGLSFDVCQGNNHVGGTHTGAAAYAWDFCMPVGTAVTAARGGTVRAVRQSSNTGGWGARFADDANFVVIDHGDGTSALYMHLMFNGARVKVGDQVQTGQLIAYSGNTGWTSAPHLHFMVMQTQADNYYSQSVPVLFLDVPTNGGLALEDNTYTSGNASVDPALLKAANTAPAAAPAFTPFWVETFKPSTLWSGPDDKAVQFGPAAPWQYFQVVAPQTGSRLQVIVAATGAPAFVPAADVGPSGAPPDAQTPARAASAASSEPTPRAAAGPGQVVIAAGDTLYDLAKSHQTTVDALMSLNGLKDPNDLQVGQVLKTAG